jgi:hypothetical protein
MKTYTSIDKIKAFYSRLTENQSCFSVIPIGIFTQHKKLSAADVHPNNLLPGNYRAAFCT